MEDTDLRPEFIQVPDDLGPAMRALPEQQQRFVIALAMCGGKLSRAAELSGCEAGNTARHYAFRVRQLASVRKAMKEWAEHVIGESVFLATAALVEIVKDPHHKDRLKAADMLMSRNGMIVAQKIEVEHTDANTKSLQSIVDNIKRLASQTGIDAKVLLQSAGVPLDVIDAEFEVVRLPAPAPARSAAGLEDLL